MGGEHRAQRCPSVRIAGKGRDSYPREKGPERNGDAHPRPGPVTIAPDVETEVAILTGAPIAGSVSHPKRHEVRRGRHRRERSGRDAGRELRNGWRHESSAGPRAFRKAAQLSNSSGDPLVLLQELDERRLPLLPK